MSGPNYLRYQSTDYLEIRKKDFDKLNHKNLERRKDKVKSKLRKTQK